MIHYMHDTSLLLSSIHTLHASLAALPSAHRAPPPCPADTSLPWRVALRDFPHPSLAGPATAGRVAPVFMLAALMLAFVSALSTLVRRRSTLPKLKCP